MEEVLRSKHSVTLGAGDLVEELGHASRKDVAIPLSINVAATGAVLARHHRPWEDKETQQEILEYSLKKKSFHTHTRSTQITQMQDHT